MLEYRTERVNPDQIDAVSTGLQVFGWKLEQTQEIYNENTRVVGQSTYLAGDKTIFGDYKNVHWETKPVTETKVTHYVTLRFSRDTNMPNYSRLKELENKYMTTSEQLGSLRSPSESMAMKVLVIGSLILSAVLTLAILFFRANFVVPLVCGILLGAWLALMIPLTVVGKKKYSKRFSDYYDRKRVLETEQKEAVSAAFALTNGGREYKALPSDF